jgi:hypothetical protein
MTTKSPPDIVPDDLSLDGVAARLGKTPAWLKWRLSTDRGEVEPKLQHHHYFGRTPQWTESEYQQLRQALMTYMPAKGGRRRKPRLASAGPMGLPSSSEAATGIFTGSSMPADAASPSAAVQNYARRLKTERSPRTYGGASKRSLSTKSSTAKSRKSPLALRLVNT